MPNRHPLEVRERATRMALDRLPDYPSRWAACRDLGEKLNVGAEDAAEVGAAGASRRRDEGGTLEHGAGRDPPAEGEDP
jgi:hypothetical protein